MGNLYYAVDAGGKDLRWYRAATFKEACDSFDWHYDPEGLARWNAGGRRVQQRGWGGYYVVKERKMGAK